MRVPTFILAALLCGCSDKIYTKFVVVQHSGVKPAYTTVFPMSNQSDVVWSFLHHPLENDFVSLLCSARYVTKLNLVLVDCYDNPNSIRAQIVVNCTKNNSLEEASTLFFGKVGLDFAHSNFKFYCE